MNPTIPSSIIAHPVVTVTIVLYVLSAAVSALPDPSSDNSKSQLFYQWIFTFAHTLLNNVEQAVRAKYPQMNLPTPIQPAQDAGKPKQ